jgi:hypothetical protein
VRPLRLLAGSGVPVMSDGEAIMDHKPASNLHIAAPAVLRKGNKNGRNQHDQR